MTLTKQTKDHEGRCEGEEAKYEGEIRGEQSRKIKRSRDPVEMILMHSKNIHFKAFLVLLFVCFWCGGWDLHVIRIRQRGYYWGEGN